MKVANGKTELTTKEWLRRAYLIDEQIKSVGYSLASLEEQIESWNYIVTECSQSYMRIEEVESES